MTQKSLRDKLIDEQIIQRDKEDKRHALLVIAALALGYGVILLIASFIGVSEGTL